MTNISCINCGSPYPRLEAPHRCPKCGGLYDYSQPLVYDPAAIDQSQPGIWKYHNSFGLVGHIIPPSLGEGNTPLLPVNAMGRTIHLKCEYANPSGSFKDRGSTTLLAALQVRGVSEAVEDSSGNAGASLAAYAARAGIQAKIYIPESASGPKRKQIESYGAHVIPVPGERQRASEAVLKDVEAGMVYASHAYLPFNLPGYATCAFEIYEQLGRAPGALITPAGQGGLLLGIVRGFEALMNADMIKSLPLIFGVQAAACAPMVARANGKNEFEESSTIAEGVRVSHPLRINDVVNPVLNSGGGFISVSEVDITAGRDALARLGFYVEPTSALIWRALVEQLSNLPDPVVAILTGSGYKVR